MVSQSILFAINTTGGGKAKLAFAAVAAGVFLVARKLNATRKAAEEFDQTFSRLTGTQREAVRAMESATKGLVDTKVEMDAVVKMTEAANGKWKVTPKIMKSIGVMAADMAQKLGEGPEGVTRRVNELTTALTKGNSRALKPFGIEIEKEGTLLEMQQEGIRKVIERAEGLTVSVTTLTEQTFALNNNWETFLGLMIGSAGTIDVLGDLNLELGTLNDSMMSVDDGFAAATLSTDAFGTALASAALDMFGFEKAAWAMNNQLGKMIEFEGKLKALKSERKTEQGDFAQQYISYGKEEWAATEAGQGGFKWFGDLGAAKQEEWKTKAGWQGTTTGEQMTFTEDEVYGKKKAAGGGGGGAKPAPKLAGEALWQSELDAAERSKQIAFDKHAWLIENNQAYHDEIERQQIEADTKLGESVAAEVEMAELTRNEEWQLQLVTEENERALETEHHEWKLLNDATYREQYLIAEQARNDADIADAKRVRDAKVAFAQSTMQGIGGIFTNLSSLMQSEHKRQFELGKKAAYAATVVNTAAAAMGAFKSLASIPYVGPFLGIAAAAAAVAAGGIQLATIKRQKFDSGGGGVSAGAVGSGGGGYLGGGGNYAAGGAAAQTTHNFTFILGEEEFHSATIAANDKASQQGKPAFATEAA